MIFINKDHEGQDETGVKSLQENVRLVGSGGGLFGPLPLDDALFVGYLEYWLLQVSLLVLLFSLQVHRREVDLAQCQLLLELFEGVVVEGRSDLDHDLQPANDLLALLVEDDPDLSVTIVHLENAGFICHFIIFLLLSGHELSIHLCIRFLDLPDLNIFVLPQGSVLEEEDECLTFIENENIAFGD